MDRKSIKYVGFYDFPNSKSNRVCNLAATNKMDYIASAINRAGYDVEIVSPSWMGDKSSVNFEKQNTVIANEGISVTFCPSWKTRNKLSRNIKIIVSLIWLFLYLLVKVKRSEKILAYHVQWISLPIRAAKFIKGFELILEVEEIYGEVWAESKKLHSLEKKLINCADSYIFVSDILKERINKNKVKENTVLYGSYYNLPINKKDRNKSERIKLVYAGSIDSTKGGAFKAIEAMRFLPGNYELHILGHGAAKQIEKLQHLIGKVNDEKEQTTCIYAGTLHGVEYSNFLSQCDIALNPQNQGEYMATAFPSKVISYLSHNLHVVSTELKSIACSSIGEQVYFSMDDNPKSIAEAIMRVNINSDYDSITLIKKLDVQFVKDIKKLLEVN